MATLKGIEIVSDGTGKALTEALASAQAEVDRLNKKVTELKENLKTVWDDSKFQAAQKNASEALGVTREKVKILKQALDSLEGKSDSKSTGQIQKLKSEIAETETQAKKLKQELRDLNKSKYDNLLKETEKVQKLLTGTFKAFKDFAGSIKSTAKSGMDFATASAQNSAQIDKMAQSVGMTYKAYQEWDYVLKQNGSGMESMNGGINTLVKKFDEFRSGSSGAVASFKELQDASGKTIDKNKDSASVFEQVVAALQDVEDFTKRTALAQNLFGESGSKLIPLLNSETKTIAELKEEAHKLGLVLDNDVITSGVSFVSNLDRLKETTEGLKNNFAAGFIPVLNQAADEFLDTSYSAEQANEQARNLGETLGEGVRFFIEASKALYDHKEAAIAVAAAFTVLKSSLAVASVIIGIVKALKEYEKATEGATVVTGALNTVISANPYLALATALLAVTAGLGVYSILTAEAGEKTKALQEEIAVIRQDFEALAGLDMQTATEQAVGSLDERISAVSEKLAELRAEVEKGPLGFTYYTARVEDDIKENEKMLETLNKEREEYLSNLETWQKKEQGLVDYRERQRIASQATAKENLERMRKDDIISEESYLDSMAALVADGSSEPQNVAYFKQAVQELDYQRSLDIISEAEYYKKIEQLRDSHLGKAGAEWRKVTVDIYKFRQKQASEYYTAQKNAAQEAERAQTEETKRQLSEIEATVKTNLDNRKKAIKDDYDDMTKKAKDAYEKKTKAMAESYKAEKEAAKDRYNAELEQIESVYKAKEDSINSAIKAIDDEIAARKRLKNEEDYSDKLAEIGAQLAYSKQDDFSRRELEAEYERLEQERADYRFELEQAAIKESLKEELEAAKELAERQKADLQQAYEYQMQQAEEAYIRITEQLKETYEINALQREEDYAKQIEQLETLATNASEDFKAIADTFVDKVDRGISITIKRLKDAIAEANSAAENSARSVSSVGKDVGTTNYSNQVNLYGTGYTDAQAQRLINDAIYA